LFEAVKEITHEASQAAIVLSLEVGIDIKAFLPVFNCILTQLTIIFHIIQNTQKLQTSPFSSSLAKACYFQPPTPASRAVSELALGHNRHHAIKQAHQYQRIAPSPSPLLPEPTFSLGQITHLSQTPASVPCITL
jgi:hypothetical protein